MKTKLYACVLSFYLFASNSSHAVNVTCYNGVAPAQIGCQVFLLSYEVTNGSNGVWASMDHSPSGIFDWIIRPKPTSTTMASHYWYTENPTSQGEELYVWAVQVYNWDGQENGDYDYMDYDTMDEDTGYAL